MLRAVMSASVAVEVALKIAKGFVIYFLVTQYLGNIERTFLDAVFMIGVFMLMLIDERLADIADKPPVIVSPMENNPELLEKLQELAEEGE